jgi:hypothetical protein
MTCVTKIEFLFLMSVAFVGAWQIGQWIGMLTSYIMRKVK